MFGGGGGGGGLPFISGDCGGDKEKGARPGKLELVVRVRWVGWDVGWWARRSPDAVACRLPEALHLTELPGTSWSRLSAKCVSALRVPHTRVAPTQVPHAHVWDRQLGLWQIPGCVPSLLGGILFQGHLEVTRPVSVISMSKARDQACARLGGRAVSLPTLVPCGGRDTGTPLLPCPSAHSLTPTFQGLASAPGPSCPAS